MTNDCILYAEDDFNDAFFLQHAFAEAAIPNPLQIVRDGQEAIDYLTGLGVFADRHLYPLPCLVLLDLKMPRKSGLEVLAWIRAHPDFRSLPVILFSSSPNQADSQSASEVGANAYVIKPSTVEERIELAQSIRSFWLHFHLRPAPRPNPPPAPK